MNLSKTESVTAPDWSWSEFNTTHTQEDFGMFPSKTFSDRAGYPPYRDVAWLTCEAILLSCIVVAFYLLYALLHFRALRETQGSAWPSRRRKGGKWLENLCIFGVLCALLRFGNNQALVFAGQSTSTCSTLINVSIAMYNVSIQPIYIFLWVRQRIFYSNRALNHLYSKTIRILSWLALFCLICVTMVCMILFIVDRDNSASGRVCANMGTQHNSTNTTGKRTRLQGVRVNTLTGLLAGCMQLFFLALFLYPIMDNKLRAVRTKHIRGNNSVLITLIRRSFVLAGLCIISDVAIALLVKIVYTTHPDAVFAPLSMYDVNLIINLLCIIMTFRRWRVMLFPWFYATRCPYSVQHKLRPSSTGKYTVNRKAPLVCLTSYDSRTQTLDRSIKVRSSQRRSNSEKRLRIPKILEPIPDVIMSAEQSQEAESAHWLNHSLSNCNLKFESDVHPYSEIVLPITYPEFDRKRSTSLVLYPADTHQAKKSKTAFAASLIAKSKSWLRDSK